MKVLVGTGEINYKTKKVESTLYFGFIQWIRISLPKERVYVIDMMMAHQTRLSQRSSTPTISRFSHGEWDITVSNHVLDLPSHC